MSSEPDLSKKLARVLEESSMKVQQQFSVNLNRVWQSAAPRDKKLSDEIDSQLDVRKKKVKG